MIRTRLAVVLWLLSATAAAAQAVDSVFTDTVVHDIGLAVHPRDWASLKSNFQLDDYYPAHFTWNGRTVRNVGIRSRGFGSRSAIKPGLRLDFDRYDRTQSLLGLSSIVLRNNTQDASSLHERVSLKLFSRLGIPSSRTAHARLFVNGHYVGLYLIVESIDKQFLARHYGENGGHLYKYDWVEPYYFEDRGTEAARYVPFPFTLETNLRNPDPAPLVEMIRLISEAPADDFIRVMGSRLDVRSFVVQAAAENFVAEVDGLVGYAGINNFYLYRLGSSGLFTFIPWDKSEAFKAGPTHSILWNISDVPGWLRNRLMDRVMAEPGLRDLYFDTLLRCAEIAMTDEWLEREILWQYEQIRHAALADPVKPYTDEEFEAHVQAMLEFARARSPAVIAEVRRTR